jgi:hypothetical protein
MRHYLHTTTIRSLMLAGVASAALAAPSHAIVPQDAGYASTPTRAAIDLRSPDAQDAGQPVAFDLRSPDAAQPVVLPAARQPIVAPHATPSDNGFDMTSALIGAAIAALLAMGAVVLVRTRRHHVAPLGS